MLPLRQRSQYTPEIDDAILVLVNDIQKATGVTCHLDVQQPLNILDQTISMQLYRIIQEAINNAVKHAQARNITIKLDNTDSFEMRISDDGKGFELNEEAFNRSLGLRIMRYRAGIIGCRLKIESSPGKGTMIYCNNMMQALK